MKKRSAALANLVFGSANVGLTLVAGLLLVPIYLRYFDLATYGAWLASGSVISAIAVFESGLSSVLTRRLATAHAAADPALFARLASSGISLAATAGILIAGAGVAVAPFVPAWVNAPPSEYDALTRAMQLASIGVGASVLFLNFGAITQAWQQTVAPGVINTVAFLVNVVVILIALRLGAGVVALGAGRLAFGVTFNLGYICYVGLHWKRKSLGLYPPTLALAAEIWRESRKLLISQVANTVSTNLESFVAAALLSPATAAVINLTGRLVATARMFLETVATSVFAGVTIAKEKMDRENFHRVLGEFLTISTSLSGLGLGCALALSASLIPLWVGPAAFGGVALLLLIAISDATSFRRSILATLLIAGAETAAVARVSMLEALARPVLLVGGVYLLGMYGAPIAGIAAAALPTVLLARLVRERLHLPYGIQFGAGRASFLTGLGVGLAWLVAVPRAASWTAVFIELAVVGALALGLTLLVDSAWRDSLRVNLRLFREARMSRRERPTEEVLASK